MAPHPSTRSVWSRMAFLAGSAAACGPVSGPASSAPSAEGLTAVCADPAGPLPPDALVCGGSATLECTSPRGAFVQIVYVPASACAGRTLAISTTQTWFPLGSHPIEVRSTGTLPDGGVAVDACTSTVTVVDTRAAVVATRGVSLWPPNHHARHVTPADCVTVTDACDPAPRVFFTWAASDEPVNTTGDGNTTADIAGLGCDGVDLLAERRGNGDGRVYTLGFRAVDHAGNATDGTCTVVVPHDQSGRVPTRGADAWRVDAPSACR